MAGLFSFIQEIPTSNHETHTSLRGAAVLSKLAPLLVVLLGFFLACLRLQGGLPFGFEVDESDLIRPAINIASGNTLNPGWFGHPGGPIIYFLAACFAWFGFDLTALSTLYFVGRALNGLLLCISFVAFFRISITLVGSRWLSCMLMLLLATSSITLFHATLNRTDSLFLLTHILFFFGVYVQRPKSPGAHSVTLGMLIGLAMGTKYIGALLFLAIPLTYQRFTRSSWSELVERLSIAGACAFATFLIANPYTVLDLPTVLRDLTFEARTSAPGADGLGYLGNYGWYVKSIPATVGVAVSACAVGSLLIRRHSEAHKLMIFSGVYLAAVSISNLHWHRYLIPLAPLFLWMAGIFLKWALPTLCTMLKAGSGSSIISIALLIVAFTPIQTIAMTVCSIWPQSTQIQAYKWIQQLPESAVVVQESFAAPLNLSKTRHITVWKIIDVPPDTIKSNWIATSSWIKQPFDQASGRYRQEFRAYENLLATRTKEVEFAPSRFCNIPIFDPVAAGGPIITIYRPEGQ